MTDSYIRIPQCKARCLLGESICRIQPTLTQFDVRNPDYRSMAVSEPEYSVAAASNYYPVHHRRKDDEILRYHGLALGVRLENRENRCTIDFKLYMIV